MSDKKIIIIAEAGVNHNGNLEKAKEMIEKAAYAGADYIKFQTFIPENMVSRFAEKAEYQQKTTGNSQTQIEMLNKLTLTEHDFVELKKECEKWNVGFLSTPFDLESIEFLETMHMDFWKIPSGEITNLPYLEKIGKTKLPIVMSTGMCEVKEIEEAIEILQRNGSGNITVLHCNTEYPTPYEDVNLRAMKHLEKLLHLPVGYSDHTKGIEVPIAAAALGAEIIEKHFTLDANMEGPDHKASLEPGQLKVMVEAIRNIEKALGCEEKKVSDSERKNRKAARKSIVAKTVIKKGERFTEDNITVKRPGTGISPMKWHEILGKTARREFGEDEIIEL